MAQMNLDQLLKTLMIQTTSILCTMLLFGQLDQSSICEKSHEEPSKIPRESRKIYLKIACIGSSTIQKYNPHSISSNLYQNIVYCDYISAS